MSNNLVKILIKAPNQLVDDQTVHCERNWTVKRLKHHLANVYPCKPHPDGQKLIYSGQLLSDEAVLSEILRSYDGLENNTIHLVCSMRDAYKMNRHTVKHVHQPVPQDFTPLPRENNTAWRDDSLRPQTSNPRPPVPTMAFPTVPNTPQDIVQQSLFFQQAYFNYMAHFSQMYMMANRVGTVDNSNYTYNSVPTNNQDATNDNRDIPVHERNENEIEEGADDVNRVNRDWLEWFYIGSRFIILFAVVYFYSSPERFILVIAMALILINIDVFRWRRVHHNQPANPTPLPEEVTEITPPPQNVVVPMNWLTVTWSFMKTFFLSLVPDNRDI